jgi:hypothetical protein
VLRASRTRAWGRWGAGRRQWRLEVRTPDYSTSPNSTYTRIALTISYDSAMGVLRERNLAATHPLTELGQQALEPVGGVLRLGGGTA